MPPTLADRLIHILTAINTIETMMSGKTLEAFDADLPLRWAVERALEIICEASHRLPDDVKARGRAIDWERMVNFGNMLRHAYHRTDAQIVFGIVSRDLPPLKAFVAEMMRQSNK
jgi:uncharacterized protein with HEPN domain